MTEKRFTLESNNYGYFKSDLTGLYTIQDKKGKKTFSGMEDEYNCKRIVNLLNKKDEEIKQLKDELFEEKKSYLIDTADISDKPYLEDEIKQLRKESYGDDR